jgi:hypothetical protein
VLRCRSQQQRGDHGIHHPLVTPRCGSPWRANGFPASD